MPAARAAKNAFTAQEVRAITGLSLPMIDYLLRTGFLRPAYMNGTGRRGQVRYYSYRDLVAARLVQRLRDSGVELRRLKTAVRELSRRACWGDHQEDPRKRLNWLVSDGRTVLFKGEDGFLEDPSGSGQRAFAFIVNLPALEQEVKALIPPSKREHYDMRKRPLLFESRQAKG